MKKTHFPYPLTLDQELIATTYHVFTGRYTTADNDLRSRIGVAINWLSKGWRNSPSIRVEDRIVFLKTGFEALSGKSNSFDCARWLRRLYGKHVGGTSVQYTDHLLWSPNEKERHVHVYQKKGKQIQTHITDFERWFLSFTRARNEIIHEGASLSLSYRGPGYRGSYVMSAERLLRESIKVSMAELGHTHMWRQELWRAIHRHYSSKLNP